MHDHEGEFGRDRWARLRFAIVGPLLAAPPARRALRAALGRLAAQSWRHPSTRVPVRFAFPTIERWYYAARNATHDNMVGAQFRQPAINLGAHQRGIAEQLEDRLPEERLHHVLPDRTIDTAAAFRGSIGVGARTSIIIGVSRRRVVRVEHRQSA
jgi:hypothetical protein